MGPSIIFDKSALQSLSRPALSVANSLFYTVIPDVLLHEVLADLSLDRKNVSPQERVAVLANKISFHQACGSMHFRKLCVQDLLGNPIPMDRRPIVDAKTARRVVTDDGQVGVFRDVQPENEAVLRWGGGEFNKEDFDFAEKWRSQLPPFNVESSTELRDMKLGVNSLDDVRERVDAIFRDTESNLLMLLTYVDFLGAGEATKNRVRFRWQIELLAKQRLPEFAPYATYCLYVYQFYYFAASHGLLPTKPNSLIDLEYFYHTPFAQVFCSSDRLHAKMAPYVLGDDQSFVDGQELKQELDALATARQSDPSAMPVEGSLIYQLWIKHCNCPPTMSKQLTSEERERITRDVKLMFKAIQEASQVKTPTERFPNS